MSEAVEQNVTETPAAEPAIDWTAAAKEAFGEDAPPPESAVDAGATPPPPATESAAESAETEPPPPPDDRIAKKIAIAKRAEIRAAQERAELKATREAIEREKAELETAKARYRLLEEDPVKAFEELKLDPKTFLEKLAGEHKPENVQARELAALKAEIESLKAERSKELETAKEREARLAAETSWTEASRSFVEFIGESAEKYPHLVDEFTEGEAVAAAERSLLEVVGRDERGNPVTRAEAYFHKFGEYPDNDVIAEHLNVLAQQRAEARQNSAWRKRESAPLGSQPVSNGDPNPKAPPVIKGSSPRTLTSRAASEKASPPKQWSQEQADAESHRILQGAFRD